MPFLGGVILFVAMIKTATTCSTRRTARPRSSASAARSCWRRVDADRRGHHDRAQHRPPAFYRGGTLRPDVVVTETGEFIDADEASS